MPTVLIKHAKYTLLVVDKKFVILPDYRACKVEVLRCLDAIRTYTALLKQTLRIRHGFLKEIFTKIGTIFRSELMHLQRVV